MRVCYSVSIPVLLCHVLAVASFQPLSPSPLYRSSLTIKTKDNDFLDTAVFTIDDFIPSDNDKKTAGVTEDEALYAFPESAFQDGAVAETLKRDNHVVDDDIFLFAQMIEDVPIGSLGDDYIEMMRGIISSPLVPGKEDLDSVRAREQILYRMADEWIKTSSDSTALCVEDFAMCLSGWDSLLRGGGKSGRDLVSTAIDHTSDVLMDLEQLYATTQHAALKPNAAVIEIALSTFVASQELGLDRQAETIFRLATEKYDIVPTPLMYESVIYLLAKSRSFGAAERAERMLREACEHAGASNIGIDTFNVVLTAWAKSRDPDSPERAEKVLVFMTHEEVEPNGSSFTSLIDAYGQQSDWSSAVKCNGMLSRMLDLYLAGDESLEPSIVAWSVVMGTWARLSKKGFKHSAEKANELLEKFEKLHAEGHITSGPDARFYITCMNTNAFSKTPEGLKRAAEILDEMNEVYLDGDETYRPTSRSLLVLLENLVRGAVPNHMVQAELLLEKYKDTVLDPEFPERGGVTKEIWRTMIYGWAQAGNPVQAQHYLYEMIDYDMELDAIYFDRVIEANYKTSDNGAMKRSYELFELLEKCRLDGKVQPNERVYTSFIRAMCRSNVPNVAPKAQTIINRMHELHDEGNEAIKPTVFTYNALLFACASIAESPSENDTKKALRIALSTFHSLRSGKVVEADHVSFGNMLRCSNLVPAGEQRDSWIKSTFALCCQRGLLNPFVLRDLKLVASDETWQSIIGRQKSQEGEEEISTENLPPAWSQNDARKKNTGQSMQDRRGDRSQRSNHRRNQPR